MDKQKYMVQYLDGSYYRDRNRTPRHFIHNATKLTLSQAERIAAETNGTVVPVPSNPIPLGQ